MCQKLTFEMASTHFKMGLCHGLQVWLRDFSVNCVKWRLWLLLSPKKTTKKSKKSCSESPKAHWNPVTFFGTHLAAILVNFSFSRKWVQSDSRVKQGMEFTSCSRQSIKQTIRRSYSYSALKSRWNVFINPPWVRPRGVYHNDKGRFMKLPPCYD